MTITLHHLVQRLAHLENQIALLIKQRDDNNLNKPHHEPNKKKPPTGYLIFSYSIRQDIVQRLQNKNGQKPKSTLVMKELGAAWKLLTHNDRNGWNDKAKDVTFIITHTAVSMAHALNQLNNNNGDIVNAILDLTM